MLYYILFFIKVASANTLSISEEAKALAEATFMKKRM
jgi:hypothetical protein